MKFLALWRPTRRFELDTASDEKSWASKYHKTSCPKAITRNVHGFSTSTLSREEKNCVFPRRLSAVFDLREELQKTQIEEDAKAVRAENQSLREQLANEQRALDGKGCCGDGSWYAKELLYLETSR